ncbi:hypothetical protein VTI28DRAFT_7405 [Corynascus sepedonium]
MHGENDKRKGVQKPRSCKTALFPPLVTRASRLRFAKSTHLARRPFLSAHVLALKQVVFVLLGVPALAAVEGRLPGARVRHGAGGSGAVFSGAGVGIVVVGTGVAMARGFLEEGRGKVCKGIAWAGGSGGVRHCGCWGRKGWEQNVEVWRFGVYRGLRLRFAARGKTCK